MADIVYPGATAGNLNADAMPTNQDLSIYKGDFVELFVTVKDAAGVPVSLAGQTPKAQLKLDYDDSAPVGFTCKLTGVTGQVRVFMPSGGAYDGKRASVITSPDGAQFLYILRAGGQEFFRVPLEWLA
jgi:hypothetical protein